MKKYILGLAACVLSTTFCEMGEYQLHAIMSDVFSENWKKISDEERSKIEKKKKTSITYGEMTIQGFLSIFDHAKKIYPDLFKNEKNVVFLDIGSGRGLVPMMFALNSNFPKAIGIEIVDSRHKEAMEGLSQLKAKYPQYRKEISKIHYMVGDVLDIKLETLLKEHAPMIKNPKLFIWISSLCFPDIMMNALTIKLNQETPSGSIIFTSKPLDISDKSRIQRVRSQKFKMTWTEESDTNIYTVK